MPPANAPLPQIYRVGTDLRVEMDAAGTHQFVVGTWSADDDQFRPCLTITNDGTVTVHGDLVVEGTTDGITISADAGVQAGARHRGAATRGGRVRLGDGRRKHAARHTGRRHARTGPGHRVPRGAADRGPGGGRVSRPGGGVRRPAAAGATPRPRELLRDALAEEPHAGGGPP